jgi:hypothetical protein
MQPDRLPAVTLEDHHPLDYIGEEAPAPAAKGEPTAYEDRNPREAPTPEQLAKEAAGDLVYSDGGAGQ